MCSHYESVQDPERLLYYFGTQLPLNVRFDVWPTYKSTFIIRPEEIDTGDDAAPEYLSLSGQFGLLPYWAKDAAFGRRTFNARSETVAEKPSFRDAWNKGQRCIIPAEAFYEPDWRTGKSVSTRIVRKDGEPMGIAGLWSVWGKEKIHSFTMLTINADDHPIMSQFHKSDTAKRMVVILPRGSYKEWLVSSNHDAMNCLRQYPADKLTTQL